MRRVANVPPPDTAHRALEACYRAVVIDERGLRWQPVVAGRSSDHAAAKLAQLYPGGQLESLSFLHAQAVHLEHLDG